MYNVLFGLASSPASKEPKIKLSLQKYTANDSSDLLWGSDSLPWRMENESAEHGIRLDLSLLERGEVDILWNKKKLEGICIEGKGYNYANHI